MTTQRALRLLSLVIVTCGAITIDAAEESAQGKPAPERPSLAGMLASAPKAEPNVLQTNAMKAYLDAFNAADDELYRQFIDNESAWSFLSQSVPLFECPDKQFEEIYYFRWWTFRKHLQRTPDGFVVTEFLPKVGWSGEVQHDQLSGRPSSL